MSSLMVNPRLAVDPRRPMDLIIDVVGNCNLRCPSCPVGNMGAINPNGLLDVGLFARIMEKATRDYSISHVELYNWAEPFLHPELPQLIRIVRQYDLPCWLSSNLNVVRNVEEVFRACPDFLRISLSGFTQEIYSQGHAKGNIERVKENMRLVSEAKRNTGNAFTRVEVFYHKYKYNLQDVEPMRRYAAELGFIWHEGWAYHIAVEKLIRAAEGTLDAEERNYVDTKYALPIVDALKECEKFKHEPCYLYDRQIVLDLQGNAVLCCGIYDYAQNTLGSFLEMSPEQLMQAKSRQNTCSSCTKHGVHRFLQHFGHPQLGPICEELVARNLRQGAPPTAESPVGAA